MNDAMFGGNKSAEATGEEDAEGSSVSGVNIVIQNRLEEIHLVDKKLYKKYLKLYVARIIEHITETNPDYLPKFQTNVKKAVARIIETFDDWQFFRGPTDIDYMNKDKAEGMLALLGYRDGSKPYMLFFKDGLIEEKAVRFFVCAVSKVKF